MAKPEPRRLAILGAGPIGLEAALYARSLGLAVTVYERGQLGEHLRRWGHVRLFSPFGMNATALGQAAIRAENPRHNFPGEGDCVTGLEHRTVYLEPLAQTALLKNCFRLSTQVLHIARRAFLKEDEIGNAQRGRQPFRLLVKEGNQRERVEEADVVLDCTGTYGQHRWLGDGGIPAVGEAAAEPHIAYGLEDIAGTRKNQYANKNILVAGGGYSAAATVCQLATLAEGYPDTWVIWLARGPSMQPLKRIPGDPLRERDRLAQRANALATRGDGNVEFFHMAPIEEVNCPGPDKGFRVTARCNGKPRTWEVDRLIANVGYTPDTSMYRELQVHECYASLGPMNLAVALQKQASADGFTVSSPAAGTLRNPEPNFFILGSKSYGRNSNFLLRIGFEQIREVFTIITGKADLDLYKKG